MRAALLVVVVALAACGGGGAPVAPEPDDHGHEQMPPTGDTATGVSDEDVFRAAYAAVVSDTAWVWYRFSADTLDAASDSPHDDRLRTRYNLPAATQLGADGKVLGAADFPDGSIIAKEIYRSGVLVSLAVMYKALGDPNVGHGGWLWGEYDREGRVLHSIAQPEAICHDCHVRGIDHTRMNDAHP